MPVLDGFFIALGRSLDRLRPPPASLTQQTTNVIPVRAHSKGLIDHLGDSAGCPHVATKAIHLRSFREQVGDLSLLFRGQASRNLCWLLAHELRNELPNL
jgi:hypothetical protein